MNGRRVRWNDYKGVWEETRFECEEPIPLCPTMLELLKLLNEKRKEKKK